MSEPLVLPDLTSVSYVMPVLNEQRYLQAAVESILQQDFAGPVEVVLALGPSTDETNRIAAELVAAHGAQVTVVSNPTGKTSAGLNAAIAASHHDVVVRVDAHSKLSAGYTTAAVAILNDTGAANVGGLMRAVGDNAFQRAVAWAYMSRIGLGGGAYHIGAEAGPADSVYLGVFRRSALQEIGGFDESIIRGQDWELNLRLRLSGRVVWFDPRLEVEYHPRSSWGALAKQFIETGAWRGQLTLRSPATASLRYFAPPALVLATFVGLIFSSLGYALGALPLGAYLGLILLAVLAGTRGRLGIATTLWLLIVLPTMHFAWGIGFIAGIASGLIGRFRQTPKQG